MIGKFDILIKNGLVVQENGMKQLDIGVRNGIIVEMNSNIEGQSNKVVDATDLCVLPGMIDVHVHFSEPGREEWEGFANGSSAASAGGCTTFFDMPLNGIPSTVSIGAVKDKAKIGQAKSVIDFGLWGGLVPGNEHELEGMANEGVIGFKAFISPTGTDEFEAVDDLTLLRGMKEIARLNKILALHSENGFLVEKLKREKIQTGKTSSDDYVESRPIMAEVEAVNRALLYGKETGCALHFVHISSKRAVELIEKAKAEGQDVSVETCPHYLLFNQDDFRVIGAEAKCAPPLREKEEQEQLWSLVKKGCFDIISSDHSPCPREMKEASVNMFEVWGGITGVQFSYLAMIEQGYFHQGISLPDITRMLATSPAKRFGFYPQKGAITLGADADFVLFDLQKSWTVREEDLLSRNKHSIYVGKEFRSQVIKTICRGQIVYSNNKESIKNVSAKWLKG